MQAFDVTSIMLFYLSCVLLLLGVTQGEASEDCPPVSSLQCTSDARACDRMSRKQAFITLNNGERCPGCMVCVRNRGNRGNLGNHGNHDRFPSLNEECPRIACYAMHIPADCAPVSYTQKVIIGLRLCPVCSTFRCTNM
ncbi:uncharacterized protein LOC123537281 [Mercenaria mercenaria]|uniref:uncharacterized protein LOC123537281 n=1 Tax=Mercenaria mercenaria TaxID=6596 RepID=UPI00234EE18E|nr:uncharacterized protein LOC123537281 [Mercenaria mercenaria]